jgi:hypothetical protein
MFGIVLSCQNAKATGTSPRRLSAVVLSWFELGLDQWEHSSMFFHDGLLADEGVLQQQFSRRSDIGLALMEGPVLGCLEERRQRCDWKMGPDSCGSDRDQLSGF